MVVTAHVHIEHTCNVRSHAECLRRHPISECSASMPDRRRRPGSAPGPPAPALCRVGPGPPPVRSSSISESSEQLPSIVSLRVTGTRVRHNMAGGAPARGVAFRTDGCLLSGGRARSESVSASCAMVGWALSIGRIGLPSSHWTHVTFKHPYPPPFPSSSPHQGLSRRMARLTTAASYGSTCPSFIEQSRRALRPIVELGGCCEAGSGRGTRPGRRHECSAGTRKELTQ